VVLRLFGRELAVITLELAVAAADRVARWVGRAAELELVQPQLLDPGRDEPYAVALPPPDVGLARLAAQLRDGDGSTGDRELREILAKLDETSKLLSS
jgi:hypothetical protein